VKEMARIVVRDLERETSLGPFDSDRIEILADVLDSLAKHTCAAGVLRVVPEEVPILLEHGAAPRGVDDDEIATVFLERVDVLSSELPRLLSLPGVKMQRSTASLARRAADEDIVPSKHPQRRFVDRSEELRHDAAFEK
jgi:hypothetical protein